MSCKKKRDLLPVYKYGLWNGEYQNLNDGYGGSYWSLPVGGLTEVGSNDGDQNGQPTLVGINPDVGCGYSDWWGTKYRWGGKYGMTMASQGWSDPPAGYTDTGTKLQLKSSLWYPNSSWQTCSDITNLYVPVAKRRDVNDPYWQEYEPKTNSAKLKCCTTNETDTNTCSNWCPADTSPTANCAMFMEGYCNTIEGIAQPECRTYCAKYPNKCMVSLPAHCSGENLNTTLCTNFCSTNQAFCSNSLTAFCSKPENEKNPVFDKICGCYKSTTYYENLKKEISTASNVPLASMDSDPRCYDVKCASASIQPSYPKSCKNNNIANCIQGASVNTGSSYLSPTQIMSSCNIDQSGGEGSKTSGTPSPAPTTASPNPTVTVSAKPTPAPSQIDTIVTYVKNNLLTVGLIMLFILCCCCFCCCVMKKPRRN